MTCCWLWLQTAIHVVAGCTFGRLKSAEQTLHAAADLHTDMLGLCGVPVGVSQNYYYHEALLREENAQQTGIQYGRAEKLLPVQLYRQLVDCLTNNCVPTSRSAWLRALYYIISEVDVLCNLTIRMCLQANSSSWVSYVLRNLSWGELQWKSVINMLGTQVQQRMLKLCKLNCGQVFQS